MLNSEEVAKAVELQAKSYGLLQWVGDAVRKGTLTFGFAHQYATATESMRDWLTTYSRQIPGKWRPRPSDPDETNQRQYLDELAAELGRMPSTELIQSLLDDESTSEAVAIAAYGHALVRRCHGDSGGAGRELCVRLRRRARVEDVDGHPIGGIGYRGLKDRFFVTPGCHDLTTKYEESFVRTSGGHYVVGYDPTVGATVALRSFFLGTETIVAQYTTNMPIRFHIPAKAGLAYWVTATFDGDRFKPRVAVLDASGERIGVILPNQPCSVPAAVQPTSAR